MPVHGCPPTTVVARRARRDLARRARLRRQRVRRRRRLQRHARRRRSRRSSRRSTAARCGSSPPASKVSLDPAFASTPAARRIAFATCVPLLTYADQPGEGGRTIIPGLARELPSVGKDGRSFTFALKAHVEFANGATVTPADVKATFERLLDPHLHSPGAALFGDLKGLAAYRDGRAPDISGITISAGRRHVPPQHERALAARARRLAVHVPAAGGHAAPPDRRASRGARTRRVPTGSRRAAAGTLTLVRNERYTAGVLGPRGRRRPDRRAARARRVRRDRGGRERLGRRGAGRAARRREAAARGREPAGGARRRRLVPADRRGLAAVRPARRAPGALARARPAGDRPRRRARAPRSAPTRCCRPRCRARAPPRSAR